MDSTIIRLRLSQFYLLYIAVEELMLIKPGKRSEDRRHVLHYECDGYTV